MRADPLNPWEDQDRLGPAGDLNPQTPNLTGMINTAGLADYVSSLTDDDDDRDGSRPEPDEPEADNAVEEDMVESTSPDNAPG
ncbi:hypothetical protein [Agromyces sp. SYSU T0242]|uniref:hypothetical protein n=1 Tax=Agromyces litoreus TaxID=3158561 RepID=UPI0033978A43